MHTHYIMYIRGPRVREVRVLRQELREGAQRRDRAGALYVILLLLLHIYIYIYIYIFIYACIYVYTCIYIYI